MANQASLNMAIVYFLHGQVLPFSIGKSRMLIWIIHISMYSGIEFKPPGRHNIGGGLLYINYKSYLGKNSQYLTAEDDTFVISLWLTVIP